MDILTSEIAASKTLTDAEELLLLEQLKLVSTGDSESKAGAIAVIHAALSEHEGYRMAFGEASREMLCGRR